MTLKGRAARVVGGSGASLAETTVPETYIDSGCELVGKLSFQQSVKINGRVEGEIEVSKRLVVGEAAQIEASISAEEVEVYGTVNGDIKVKRKVTLHESARVTGEIQTAGIVVQEGARFKGTIVIGSDSPPAVAASPVVSTGSASEKKSEAA